LTHEHEAQMIGPCMIKNFPTHTSPFWNMKQNGDGTAAKIDVILGGMETIGSAERSVNKQEMRDTFHTISGGKYASLLNHKFGYDRVEKELKDFLSFDFFPRVGGGIGLTRLLRIM
jgi:aspartyl/asparaginyl-tRNA synthetase